MSKELSNERLSPERIGESSDSAKAGGVFTAWVSLGEPESYSSYGFILRPLAPYVKRVGEPEYQLVQYIGISSVGRHSWVNQVGIIFSEAAFDPYWLPIPEVPQSKSTVIQSQNAVIAYPYNE